MQSTNVISRRKLFSGATAIVGAALCAQTQPSKAFASATTAPAPHPWPDTVEVIRPGDAGYSHALTTHFHDLNEDARFQAIRPLSFVVINKGTTPIRALRARWRVTTESGVHRETLNHFTPTYVSADGQKIRAAGRRSLVPAGAATLITPHWSLSSNSYKRGVRPGFSSTSRKTIFHHLLAAKVAQPSAVSISLKGGIIGKKSVVGKQGSRLEGHMRLLENAQHDEAISIKRYLGKRPVTRAHRKLISRKYTPLSVTGSASKRSYQSLRRQHAKSLLHVLKTKGDAVFLKSVAHLAKEPKRLPLAKS